MIGNFSKKTKYNWWMNRIDLTRRLFDVTRIDHFRAFDTYYAIPYGEETAVNGQWMEGPGIDFLQNAAPVAGKRADHRRGSGAFRSRRCRSF